MSPGTSRKRPRTDISERSRIGLAELFGYGEQNDNLPTTCRVVPPRQHSSMKESFCSFRIEQRLGGILAQHYGEERFLVFSSSQRGAVAKIVFSSERRNENSSTSVCAKIHSLSVKEAYRGYGLGSLLFSMAVVSLSNRYLTEAKTDALKTKDSTNKDDFFVECSLDAEEDVRRHDKLVNFYRSCGCHVKPNAKISYINNNDGETYRKVPMQITLLEQSFERTSPSACTWANFLPMDFFSAHHERAQLLGESIPLDWFVLEIEENLFEFRSTNGRLLAVGNDRWCTVTNGTSTPSSQFLFQQTTETQASKTKFHCESKSLCIIKSRSGQYLGIDPVQLSFICSEKPSYWQTGNCERSLVCVKDSPARRQHYLHLSSFQTREYILRKRERYFRFDIGRLTLKEALDLAGSIQADEFGEERCDRSLCSLLYATAEESRRAEFPDWFQLVGLIHGLATVLRFIDADVAKETMEEGYDWTICSQSVLIGSNGGDPARSLHPNLQCASGETPANNKNIIVADRRIRHDGLGNYDAALLWTGPEYMYNMLKHNGIDLPEEAFAVLRWFPVNQSERQQQCSKALAETIDRDVLGIVQDFCDVRETARRNLFFTQELHEFDCTSLWNSHFSRIFEKYGADKHLQW
ncbi:unnamed protein product [Cylindrotheca closterium]|uniref:Inositol oxygenase n=1 Tax=Cylindrotheca closterium TaxID=2856 RepID=A0AAD2JPA6_9STRA|nr:unnamed protein product [Cylindrotheca closterium]